MVDDNCKHSYAGMTHLLNILLLMQAVSSVWFCLGSFCSQITSKGNHTFYSIATMVGIARGLWKLRNYGDTGWKGPLGSAGLAIR